MDESKERLSFFRKGWLVKILVIICGVVALLSCIQIESDLQDEGSVTIKFNYKNIIYSDGINQNIGLSSNKDLYGHSYGRSLNEGDPTSMPTSMPTTIQIEEDLLLFGGFRFLAGQTAAVSFICIVLVILLLEHFFHEIHSLTHDTPFAEMVSAMEKELMIVGCTSFAYKVLLTLTNFMDPSTVHTVDVLDTVTVIAALVFCVGGLVLIWMSIRETDIWSQSFHLHVLEILCEYYAVAEDALHDTDEEYWWGLSIEKAIEKSLQSWRWLPVSRINAEIEFRVIHTAFCDTFNLQKDAFAFDDYVSRCFEKHILTLITIDPMNWILLLVLCCVNWLRVYLGFWGPQSWCAAATLRETAGTDDPTVLRDAEIVCKAEVELYCFFGMGCIMVVLNLLLAGVSRYYEFKVMAREGVHCLADYPEFLIAANMAAVAVRVEKTRLSADDLKAAIIASEEHADTIAIEQNPLWNLIASFLSCFYKRTNVMDRQDATRVTKNGQWSSMIMRQLRPDSFSTIDSNEIKGKVSSKGISNKGSTKAGTGNSGSPKRKRRKRRVKKEDGAEEEHMKAVLSTKKTVVGARIDSGISDASGAQHGARFDSGISDISAVPHGARIDSGISAISGVSGASNGSGGSADRPAPSSNGRSQPNSGLSLGSGGSSSAPATAAVPRPGTLTPPRHGHGQYTITEGEEVGNGLAASLRPAPLVTSSAAVGGRMQGLEGTEEVQSGRDRITSSGDYTYSDEAGRSRIMSSGDYTYSDEAGRSRIMSDQQSDSDYVPRSSAKERLVSNDSSVVPSSVDKSRYASDPTGTSVPQDDVDTDIAATHRPKGLISGAAYGTLSSGDSIPGEDRAAFSLKKASTMRDMEEEYNKNRKQVMAKSLKTADGRDMMGVFWSDNADLCRWA